MAPGAGAVGRVRAVGPDATRLAPGDWVYCAPTVRSRDDALTPDITLQGASARGEGGLRLQEYLHHGSFAELVLVPTENVVPIGSIDAAEAGAVVCAGPAARAARRPPRGGPTSRGDGRDQRRHRAFGSAGVALALAMGASCVVAPGRNEKALEDLTRRFGRRVRTVALTGEESEDRERMKRATPGPIDCALDIPPFAGATVVRAAAMTVREFGRVVLMGGVGMLGGDGVPFRTSAPTPVLIRATGLQIILEKVRPSTSPHRGAIHTF